MINHSDIIQVANECKKLAICITFHYSEPRLKYFEQVCKSLEDVCPEVVLTVVTSTSKEDEIRKIRSCVNTDKFIFDFFIPQGIGHPYLLAWSHLDVFRRQFEDPSFTHFLYVEDDIKITKANINYWLTTREKLRPFGLIPGFFRFEQNDKDGERYSSDVMARMSLYDCSLVELGNGEAFIGIVYPYQGLYFLDRSLMQEHLVGPSSNPDFDHSDGGFLRVQSHDLRARAALCLTFVGVPKDHRSRYVLPFDASNTHLKPVCLVHHLPNNYTNNPATPIGKIKVDDIFIPKSLNTYFRKRIKTTLSSLLRKMLQLSIGRTIK